MSSTKHTDRMIQYVDIKIRIWTEPYIKATTDVNILRVLRHGQSRNLSLNLADNRWKVVMWSAGDTLG